MPNKQTFKSQVEKKKNNQTSEEEMKIKAGWILPEGWQGGDDPLWMAAGTEQTRGGLAGRGLPDAHCLARAAQAEELAASSDSGA